MSCETAERDRALVLAYRAGTPGAGDRLVEAYRPLVAQMVRRSRYSPRFESFEDAEQVAWTATVRGLPRWEEGRGLTLGAWLGPTVRNALTQKYGRVHPPERGLGGDDYDPVADALTPEPGPARRAIQKEEAGLLGEAVAQLPEREATVVRMRYGLGGGRPMFQEEVGEHLGVTKQRVQQIEDVALRRLRSLLVTGWARGAAS